MQRGGSGRSNGSSSSVSSSGSSSSTCSIISSSRRSNSNSGIAKPTKIVGRRCLVTTSGVSETFGQAEIEQENAAPITLNVRCRPGRRPLKKGDEALILELIEDNGTYIVVPFDLEVN